MILIVDDDPIFLGSATTALTAKDERVLCAQSATRALDLVKKIGSEFGLALIDLDLPDTNGFQLISMIKTLDEKLPVIAISEVFSDTALDSSKAFGAQETLRKPISDQWRVAIARLRRRPSNQ